MAKHKLATRSGPPMVSKNKYEKAQRAAIAVRQKASRVATQRAGMLAGLAGVAGYAYLEKHDHLPQMGGLDPALVVGGVLGFVVPEFVKGKGGQMAAEAGTAVLSIAVYNLARSHL